MPMTSAMKIGRRPRKHVVAQSLDQVGGPLVLRCRGGDRDERRHPAGVADRRGRHGGDAGVSATASRSAASCRWAPGAMALATPTSSPTRAACSAARSTSMPRASTPTAGSAASMSASPSSFF
jgi:hypothetical protein